MITNTKVFGNELDKNINEIFFDNYAVERVAYPDIAKVSDPPLGVSYTESELSPLGNLRLLPEGTGITFDNPVEGNKKTLYWYEYGLGFQITKKMYRDDVAGNFKRMPQKLSKSAAIKPEVVFFNLFNNSFDSETSWDDVYVCATSHKTLKSKDTIANRPSTDAALSETSLEAGFEYYDNLVDEAGLPITMTPFLLVTKTANRWIVRRLNMQEYGVASANRDLNLVAPRNGEVEDWRALLSRHISSSTAWWLLAKEHDFRLLWKEQATLESADDFYTGNALFKVTLEFGAGVFDYKGVYGTSGA